MRTDRYGNQDWRRQIDALQREFERMHGSGNGGSSVAFLPGRSARAYPLVNLAENSEGFTVEALAPGIDPDSIQITVVRNILTLSGRKSAPEGATREAFHRTERAAGQFVRNLELPTEVDPDQVEARYANGLLVVSLPKAEAARPRQIQVKVN